MLPTVGLFHLIPLLLLAAGALPAVLLVANETFSGAVLVANDTSYDNCTFSGTSAALIINATALSSGVSIRVTACTFVAGECVRLLGNATGPGFAVAIEGSTFDNDYVWASSLTLGGSGAALSLVGNTVRVTAAYQGGQAFPMRPGVTMSIPYVPLCVRSPQTVAEML